MPLWAHDMRVTHLRGGLAIITCSCGEKSGKIPRSEVEDRISQHRSKYLREKPDKRKEVE